MAGGDAAAGGAEGAACVLGMMAIAAVSDHAEGVEGTAMSDKSCCAGDTCCRPAALDFSKLAAKPVPAAACADEACGCSRRGPGFRRRGSPLHARPLDRHRRQWHHVLRRDNRRTARRIAGAEGRRPRLLRRHGDLRPQPGRDRRQHLEEVDGGPVQRPVAQRLGRLCVRVHSLPDPGSRASERGGHGHHRHAGACSPPWLPPAADALQGRRRQRTVCLAVLPQRRHRQRHRHVRRPRRMGIADGVARSGRRQRDGVFFDVVVRADTSAGVGGIFRRNQNERLRQA